MSTSHNFNKTTDEHLLALPRLNLRDRQLHDLEMLMVGGFAPLSGFMDEATYHSVLTTTHLPAAAPSTVSDVARPTANADVRRPTRSSAEGSLSPIPVVLDVPNESTYAEGDDVLLCDEFGNPLAVLHVTSRYTPDKHEEVRQIYGTDDETHPGVWYVTRLMYDTYLGGDITPLNLPTRHDFKDIRHTPEELKARFTEHGWERVIGFQTRNPMHKVHFELIKRAHERIGAPVLIHPVVGMTREGDIDYITRVRTYKIVHRTYGKDFTDLSLLPLSMRMAGPREALWHALIRRNYGCTHFIVGRDHAGPGVDKDGEPFYAPHAARDLALAHEKELGIEIVPSDELAYVPGRQQYLAADEIAKEDKTEHISGTEFRRRLADGEEIPDWFSFPECIEELKKGVTKQKEKGLTIFFTGLSGAGKSTIATMLASKLLEIQDKNVTLLDGDIIRQHLTEGLGFSKEDRDTNVRRVGYVASEITKHGGIAITSLIAPYAEARRDVRELVGRHGAFVEVYVSTPIDVCEERDTKGLYKKAREGLLKQFTGIDDPYEEPRSAEIVIDTTTKHPDDAISEIITHLTTHHHIHPVE